MPPPLPTRTDRDVTSRGPVAVDLALQGGRAHGALTWGVLYPLLQQPWLRVDGISGTSAGAMNAAVLADGHAEAGAEGARGVGAVLAPRLARRLAQPVPARAAGRAAGALEARQLPGLRVHGLRRAGVPAPRPEPGRGQPAGGRAGRDGGLRPPRAPIKLFVTATDLRTRQGRVFRSADLTPDALLASACLPTMFQAVEIDGRSYWDGGCAGNPTITPLVRECESNDTVLVQVNPVERPEAPRTARGILNRVNEVAFNATLLKGLRMIALLRQVADPGDCEGAGWARMRAHRISSAGITAFGSSSKLNAEWDFLCLLRDEGRRAASAFLATHAGDLGRRSTLGVDALLAGI